METSANPHVLTLLKDIERVGKTYSQNEPGSREQLLTLAYSLAPALELPNEALQRMGWAEPACLASIQIASELQLFEEIANKKDIGVTITELANISNADPTLISRIMKHLGAMNVVGEKDVDHYLATPFSTALTDHKWRSGISFNCDIIGPSFHQLPAYLQSISYTNSINGADGPFQYAHKTSASYFEWLSERPDRWAQFNSYMNGYRATKPSWVDPGFYPVEERLGTGMKSGKDDVFLVDVGGGLGQDLELLIQKHSYGQGNSYVQGRLVLQDQYEVISQVRGSAPSRMYEKMAHDFFTPQPVKGARAYNLHSVLHNWDDASAINIIKNIASAMEKGYSKLLINELVVADQGASWSITSMDLLMLALVGVKERTEQEWHRLVEAAGLKITGIWSKGQGTESLIECQIP